MPIERSAGEYNGRGALVGSALPSPYQCVGEWGALESFVKDCWAVYGEEDGKHAPTLPMNSRPPRGTRDEVDTHAPIPQDVTPRVADAIRNRTRPAEERAAREKRQELIAIPETSGRSPYADDFTSWAKAQAAAFVLPLTENAEMPEHVIEFLQVAAERFARRYKRQPANLPELQEERF